MGLNFVLWVAAGGGAAGEENGEEERGDQGEDHEEGEDDPERVLKGGEGGMRRRMLFKGSEKGIGVGHVSMLTADGYRRGCGVNFGVT